MVKLLRYFFANVLMRLCGFIRGLLCFLQFIVCGSWCLYAFVELRISSVFIFVGTIVLRYVLRYVLFISLVFFGAIHVRCVSEMWFRWFAWPMNRWSEIWMFRAVEIVKRGVLFMFLSPFGMFLCIFVCLSFYLFNELYIWITK